MTARRPGSAEEAPGDAGTGTAATVVAGTLGDLLARRTARSRRLMWKRLGLAASGTFTLAAALTVATGSFIKGASAPASVPEPQAQPRSEAGPLVQGPIVAPEPPPTAPTVSPPAISLAPDAGSGGSGGSGSGGPWQPPAAVSDDGDDGDHGGDHGGGGVRHDGGRHHGGDHGGGRRGGDHGGWHGGWHGGGHGGGGRGGDHGDRHGGGHGGGRGHH